MQKSAARPFIFIAALLSALLMSADAAARTRIVIADSPDFPPVVLEKGQMYDIEWGSLGQVVSVRWTAEGVLEMAAIVGDFSIGSQAGNFPLAARIREAGRLRLTNMSDVQVRLSSAGPSFAIKTNSDQFDIHYNVFDTQPGETHFYELYSLRLQRRADPKEYAGANTDNGDELPDFFLPHNRGVRAIVTEKGIVFVFINPSVPEIGRAHV